MSHDGSSCKSYIKHPTEKERLDNLAFTSFPEDYLPYTSAYQQGGREGGKAPPYLVWDERRPRRNRKHRRRCCSMAALVSAIALIVTAILAVVAISVYLGVVTNLFRSPVLSLSGKFRVSEGDEFLEELLNNTSYQFLIKTETYQAMVESVLLSSSLEPAFIAARIYAFRPGMLVFFRVYLDRRKLQQDDSNTISLMESLFKGDSPAFGALSIDRESVDVDENEEWISIPGIENRIAKTSTATSQVTISPPDLKRIPSHLPPPKLATDPNRRLSLSTKRPTRPPTTSAIPVITSAARDPVPIREESRTGTGEVYPIGPSSPEEDTLNFSYGQWKPVPIEDSVSPSFGDQRTPPGRGSVRFVDEVIPPPRIIPPRVNLDRVSPPKRTSDSNPLHVGVGSVSVLDDPLSHVDPVPIPIRNSRPLRPIVPEAHQRGDVASSIMSSVSLVVRPTNKKNKTSLPESGRLEMAKPIEVTTEHPFRHPAIQNVDPPVLVRNDHASYRFLGIMDDDASGDKTLENELKATQPSIFETRDFPSSTIKGLESFSDNKENSDLFSQEKKISLPNNHNESSVEYWEQENEPKVESTNTPTTNTIMEEIQSLQKHTTVPAEGDISSINMTVVSTTVLPQTKENAPVYEDAYVSEYDYDFTTDSANDSYEATTEDLTIYDTESNISNENGNGNALHIYSAKSDIGLRYENYSNSESTPFPVVRLTGTTIPPFIVLSRSEDVIFSEESSVEESSSSSPSDKRNVTLHTEDDHKQNTDPSNLTIEFKTSSVPVNEFSTTSVQEETTVALDEDYFHSTLFMNDTSSSENLINESDPSFAFEITTTNRAQQQTTTTQEKSLSVAELQAGSYDAHTLEGHGFHKPVMSLPEAQSTADPLDSAQQIETISSSTNPPLASSTISITLTAEESEPVSIESRTELPILLDFSNSSKLAHSNESEKIDAVADAMGNVSSPSLVSTEVSDNASSFESTSIESTNASTAQEGSLEDSQSTTERTASSNVSFESATSSVMATTEENGKSEESSLPSTDLNEGLSNDTSVVLSGVPKIVPQLSDLSFNPNDIESDDGSFIGLDNDLHKEDFTTTPLEDISNADAVEVIRHITTLGPKIPAVPVSLGKHPVFISQSCLEDEMQCDSGECIDSSSRCNMRRDCRDNSDEKNCSCSELLKVMGQSQKICDGVEDCQDHTDEQNCPWCEEGQIICPQSKFCVNRSQMCDGHNDCPMGTDEKYCVKLAESIMDAEGVHYRSNGYLMVRKDGEWGKLCLDNLQDSDSLRLKLDELGEAVCSTLTYRNMSESKRTENPVTRNDTYYVISNQVASPTKKPSAIFKPSSCESKEVMRVQCASLDCGLRPLASSSRRRIVGGSSAASGSWPWQVALYKEGDFQCGAVLISDTWLISAGHCFFSSQSAHWTARLGLLRRGSELPSPYEQIHRIEQIFLHPNYVDIGFINDIALLRLEKPVLFSDYLRPVCLPLENEDASTWHGKQCSVVGWGKLYEIGHTFPDSLQEVRLPVISTEECRKKIIFLTMYHLTDNMFCAGFERGGRDACLGDSGGPLMCQRDDGRWILLGVTSNGDGCGRPGRPGVYTKVAHYLGWIKQVMESKYTSPVYEDTCEGIRCRLGRCIPPYKMCDNRWDCSEGSDEDNCID